ncbi:MAG: isopentenyl-diphosphate Delta-isomerase [Planctomycetota bacterium]
MADEGRASTRNVQVSFDDEPLILVDAENHVLGHESKVACHEGEGILHRAFSVFLFDGEGRVLLQQRAAGKPLWPLHWSNSVCSHPRRGETEEVATARRVREELGVEADLEYLFRFRYHARYGDRGSERELCSVYLGRPRGEVKPNETEIADWKWIDVDELTRALEEDPDAYTPWFKMEWARIRTEFEERLRAHAGGGAGPDGS